MKTKFSKRMLAIFLSIVTIATTIPMFTMTADADVNSNVDDKYVFAYFLGDGEGQHVRFAISTDGIKFSPLNGNSPFLQEMSDNTVINTHPNKIEHNTYKNHVNKDGYTRDPFICRKANGNGYYIVGTDLHVGDVDQTGDYNNSRIYVWDVQNIADADNVKPIIIETVGWFGTTYQSNNDYVAWAPEVIWDSAKGMYMLYWAGPLYANAELKFVYTSDFRTFYNSQGGVINGTNQPETLYKHKGNDTVANTGNYAPTSGNTIDGDIAYDATTGYYYLVYKFEAQGQLYIVKSTTLTGFNADSNHAVKFVDSRISGLQKSGDNDKSHLRFEGPELYQAADGKWILVTDQYAANPSNDYYMYAANSIDEFMTGADMQSREVTYTNIDNCYPRHGAVAKITNEEFLGLASDHILPDSFPYSYPVSKTPNLGDDLTKNPYGMYSTDVCSGSSVLYSYSNPDTVWADSRYQSGNNLHFRIVGPDQVVALYDGVTPVSFPVAFQFCGYGNWGGNSRGVSCVYPCVYSNDAKEGNLPGKDPNFSLTGIHQYFNGSWITDDNCYWQGGHDNSKGGMRWTSINNYISATTQKQECGYDPDHYKNTRYGAGASGAIKGEGTKYNYYNNLKLNVSALGLSNNFESYNVAYHFAMEGGNLSADNKPAVTGTKAHFNNVGKVTLINYVPIKQAADEIRTVYETKVKGHENEYCPEALDEYYANLALVACDPSNYFLTGNNVDACIERFRKSVAAIEDAKREPAKSRIQFGNIFDFDAYLASGSNDHGTLTGYSTDRETRTITCTGTGDQFSSMALNVFTYKLPVEEGEHYIFEMTSDSPYGDAMIFIPNQAQSSYNSSYVSWRPHGEGTKKVELTIPTYDDIGYHAKYVFFRVGVQGSTSEVTAHISRIRLYKSEYENWASNTPDAIPEPRLTNHCDGLKGSRNVRPISYGTSLYSAADKSLATDLAGKHFCGWYTDEELTNLVTQEWNSTEGKYVYKTTDGKGLSGCTTLYAKYETHKFKWNDTNYNDDTASFPCLSIESSASDLPKDILSADTEVYDYLEMIYQTLDVDRFGDNAANLKAGKAKFDAMKTTEFYIGTKPAGDTSDDIYFADAEGQRAQALVDQSNRALLNAMNDVNDASTNLGNIKTYNLTFNIYQNGTIKKTYTYNKAYNSVMTLDASSDISGTAQAWTISSADALGINTVKAASHKEATNTYDVLIQANTVVNAYYVTDDAPNVAIICDQYGRTLYQFATTSVQVKNNNTITVNGADYKVPDMPNMAVTGYKMNGTAISGTVAISGVKQIVPTWNTPGGAYAITLNGQPVGDSSSYAYDDKVTVTAPEGVYGIAIKDADNNYKVVTYSNEYSFFANRNMQFYSVTKNGSNYVINGTTISDKLTVYKLDNKLPFVYSGSQKVDGKYTAFNAYTTDVPAGITIIERGTLFTRNSSVANADMVIDNAAVSKIIAKNIVDPGNQYSVSTTNTSPCVKTRAYVKYSYTNTYGDTIVAIEYGNVCSAN